MKLVAALTENPVLVKELRVRMRGARAYWILTGYLAFLSFILFFMYVQWWTEAQRSGGMSSGSKVGQTFFLSIMVVQAFLVAFITPAVTSGAITIEREQRTIEMLTMTRMSRGAIVAGKLFSAISFVALLLVSSVPLTSICFLLGGVSPDQVANAYAMLLAGAFISGALGLAWSSVAKTTAAAVIFTYSTLLAPPLLLIFSLGVVFAGAMGGGFSGAGGSATAAAAVTQIGSLYGLSAASFGSSAGPFSVWGLPHYYSLTLPLWVAPVCTYTLFGLILAALATSRLETFPERRAGLLRALVAAFVAEQCFFLFGAWFSAYGAAALSPSWVMSLMTPLPVLVFPTVLLLLIGSVFCTGELRSSEAREFGAYLRRGWTPHGMRRGRLNSGLPYVLLLAAIVLGLYALSFALVGKAGAINSGKIGVSQAASIPVAAIPPAPGQAMPSVPGGPSAVVARAGTATIPRGGFWPVCAAVFSTMVGLWAFGFLISVVVRSRWASLALVFAGIHAVLIAPTMAHLAWLSDYMHRPPSPMINLYYLNPVIAILHLAEPPGHSWDQLPLLFKGAPIWLVTTLAHLILGGACFLVSIPFVRALAARKTAEHDDLATTV